MENVAEIVRQLEAEYTSGNTNISKYVQFDMFETLNKIDAYLASIHISGSTDSLGREKPFFNIVTAARNIWYRATDIDRKNIRIRVPSMSQYVMGFAADMLLKQWMRKADFGQFLNTWGLSLATYGSAVSKFVEKDGELIVANIPWNRIICDPINFNNNVVIEVLEFTPAQLKKQGYDPEVVNELIESLLVREDLGKQKKDNKAGYIKVYEVHGELPLELLTGKEEDSEEYTQQMQVVSFTKGKYNRNTQRYDYQDFTLYKGKEKKSPYQKDDLIEEDGRTLAIGPVESLFDPQWMVNHSAKQIKDTLDFASLLILQTSDGSMAGRNVLNDLVTGNFLIYDRNQDPNGVQQVNVNHDITQIQSFSNQWQNLSKEITGTPDALRGNTQPSGTAYRLQELITNQSESLFEVMVENKGLAIERMIRNFIIPFLKTKMDNSDEISAILDAEGLQQFDSIYVPNEAKRRNNERIKNEVLSGQISDNGDIGNTLAEVKNELAPLGSQRFLKPSEIDEVTWKETLKDFEWDVLVNPTQEDENIQDALATLQSTFQTIVSLAGRPMSHNEQFVFNKIMEKAGTLSPLQLNSSPVPQTGGSTAVPKIINQPVMAQTQ